MLKRAQYEAFSFEVEPGRVTVRNQSYADPIEHEYSVRVIDGVPTACTCPADEFQEVACKHRLAVAIRSPVQDAAAAEAVADGGVDEVVVGAEQASGSSPTASETVPDDCACEGMPDDLPCWPCYRDGVKQLPSERT